MHLDMSWHILSYLLCISWHALASLDISWHVLTYHDISCDISWHILTHISMHLDASWQILTYLVISFLHLLTCFGISWYILTYLDKSMNTQNQQFRLDGLHRHAADTRRTRSEGPRGLRDVRWHATRMSKPSRPNARSQACTPQRVPDTPRGLLPLRPISPTPVRPSLWRQWMSTFWLSDLLTSWRTL